VGSASVYLEAFITKAIDNTEMTVKAEGVCLDGNEASGEWVKSL
jgi:hypothetical protein